MFFGSVVCIHRLFFVSKNGQKSEFRPRNALFSVKYGSFKLKTGPKERQRWAFCRCRAKQQFFGVRSGLNIEKTGPETAKISPKKWQKRRFSTQKCKFSVKFGSFKLKTGSKERQRWAFCSCGVNNIFLVRSGLKTEKTGPETATISPKNGKKKAIFDPKMQFLGQIRVF